MDERLTMDERALLRMCAERYLAELRQACEEDQGTPNGRPGTIGYTQQIKLRSAIGKLRGY